MSEPAASPEIWLVFLPEWLIEYTSKATGEAGWEECRDEALKYAGTLYSKDWRIITLRRRPGSGDPEYRWQLQLRLNNVRGEFKDRKDADELKDRLGPDAEVVAKFSRRYRVMVGYGKRPLHA